MYHRSYNNYNKEAFKIVLKEIFISYSYFEEFFDTFLATLDENGRLKEKDFDLIIR